MVAYCAEFDSSFLRRSDAKIEEIHYYKGVFFRYYLAMHVQFLHPPIHEEDIQAAAETIRSGWLVLGKETEAFEKEFAQYLGCKHAVLTNSCTSSLEICLTAANIQPGDEVIVTALTYVASINPVLLRGAKPVFVDAEEAAITSKTKMILPVHLYGQLVPMRALHALAVKHGLLVLEDAAHAIESEYEGVRSAQLGYAACFSFHSAKNLTAGQGGMIATNNDDLAEAALLLRRDGIRADGPHRKMYALGRKCLATEYQATLLRCQLRRLDDVWQKRKALYDAYASAFDSMGLRYNPVLPGARHAYHMMVLWVDPLQRDAIRDALTERGVETSVHYNPVHLEPYFRENFHCKEGQFPVAERLGLGAITLPLYPDLTQDEQAYVLHQIQIVIQEHSHVLS
jgi:dTDP-4-amino-4,6-dideoxygalactose transaminase